jgi:hypothetical protein
MFAAAGGKLELVRLLLSKGANVFAITKEGQISAATGGYG